MNARNVSCLLFVFGVFASLQLASAEDDKPAASETKPAAKAPEQIFSELDKNEDGKLTADEVPEGQKRFFGHLLRVADKDKDGALTKAEFLEGFKPDDLKVAAPQNLIGPAGGGQFDPKQIFQRLDRNKDGKLALDEIQGPARDRLKPIFDRLGKTELTLEEYTQAVEQFRGGAAAGAFMRDPDGTFKQLDKNGDGKLTLDEVPEQSRQQLERWLQRVQKGKDDSLTLDDLKKIVAENTARGGGGPPGSGGFQSPFFRKLDANGDGKLSKEEFEKAPALFDELDLNKDGFLDAKELLGAPPGGLGFQPPGALGRPAQQPEGAPVIKPDEEKSPKDGGGDATAANTPAAGSTAAPLPGRKANRPAAQKGQGQGPLRRFDTNDDGKVSRDEAQGRLKEHFDKIDTNGDGYLEPDELRKALEYVRGTK